MSEKVAGTSGENEETNKDTVAAEESPEKAETGEDKAAEEPVKNGKGKRRRLFIIGGIALVILAIAGTAYWLYERQFESTDDAFIEGDITQVSPKVSAYITKIYVKNNQLVHKGDLLVELDPKDYEAKLEQAKAQLSVAQAQHGSAEATVDLTRKTTGASQTQARSNVETARNNVEQNRAASEAKRSQILQAQTAVKTAQANLAQTRAQIQQAEGDLHLAQVEFDRRQKLFNNGDISKQNLDQATSALQTARSQYNSAQKQIDAAESRVEEARANVSTAQENFKQSQAQIDISRSQVGESAGRLEDANAAPERVSVSESQVDTSKAGIEQAEAAVHEAELELSYTKILAPEEGFITRKTIEEGQLIQAGTPMMAVSQSDEMWVIANFKETQLANMQPGQAVDIYVDAYPSQSFHGKVDSVQAGTGSRFSVLPAENATGNYVKVVQRVPVKIVFDSPPDDAHRLVPGMSVQPTVRVR
jgi:membrane fusion protein (multidrug efflux system)